MTVAAASGLVRLALVGNPNTGKSTLFNRLTGLRQHIANYPGITVEKKTGLMDLDGERMELIDLPGSYSLAAASPDERVVMDALSGRIGFPAPDLLICVVDATNLKRNLFLVSQCAELEIPMVIVLNQWDAAQRSGMKIDCELLAKRLGVPVIPTVARTGIGVLELKQAIRQSLNHPARATRVTWPDFALQAREHVRSGLPAATRTDPELWRLIFDADSSYNVGAGRSEDVSRLVHEARAILRENGLNPGPAEAVLHYRHIDSLLDGVVTGGGAVARTRDSVDRILLHRVWGTLAFFAVMYVVFQSLYAWAGPLMDVIEVGTGWLQELVSPLLSETPMLQSLVTDGVIAGVGGVVIFLPQILILFFCLAILEDSGYLARAAFLMDKLFGWCGLNGKSFVPLISGYACAIPGVMAARTLEDPKARITTILMTPFMSCSARLPVYVLLIGAFIEPAYGSFVAGWMLFAMHFVGAFVALPFAWVMNRLFLKIQAQPFILEMPDYRVPALRNVILRMWERGREFLVRAGTVILAFSVIIWALLYFPRPEAVADETRATFVTAAADSQSLSEVEAALADPESDLSLTLAHRIDGAYIEQSYLGRFGKAVQPVFDPAGFDWKITVGVLSSFPAREVIIATMGIIYNLGADVDEGSDDLRSILARERWHDGPRAGQPVYTIPVVLALMVFFALCMQCAATLAVVAKELNWRWTIGLFVVMTTTAWVAAVVTYQIGSWF